MAANSGTISVISTEGGIFDVMAGRYNSRANIDVWLKGHCGDAIYVDRKTREAESILHPTLSAILTIQPSVLEEIMDNTTMSGRGLLADSCTSFRRPGLARARFVQRRFRRCERCLSEDGV